jgi:hypothetical protein
MKKTKRKNIILPFKYIIAGCEYIGICFKAFVVRFFYCLSENNFSFTSDNEKSFILVQPYGEREGSFFISRNLLHKHIDI